MPLEAPVMSAVGISVGPACQSMRSVGGMSGSNQTQFLAEIVECKCEPLAQAYFRLPSKPGSRQRDVGPAPHRIVGWRGPIAELGRAARNFNCEFGQLAHREFVGIAEIDR